LRRRLLAVAAALAACAALASCAGLQERDPALAVTPLLDTGLARRAIFAGADRSAGRQVLELEQKKDWTGLIRLARERLAGQPDSADWEVIAGYALLQTQDYAQAAAAFARATRRSPEDVDAWNLLGESFRLSRDPARAIRTLEHAVTISRTSNIAYFLLGEAYRDAGRPDRAIQAYRESLRIEPEFSATWFSLGLVYLQTGRREELDAVLEQLRKLNRPLAEQLEKARKAG
jgi:tetratricopeptide (TPR) repeat protein